MEAVTASISSNGFLCSVSERFRVGERVSCLISIPWFGPHRDDVITVDCWAHVVCADESNSPCTIACSIDDYHVVGPAPAFPTRALQQSREDE